MKKLLTSILLLTLILISSCQVSENITIKDNISTSETNIEVYDFFIAVLNDFSQFMDNPNDASIVNTAFSDFANGLASNENNSNVVYMANEGNKYYLSFDFVSISNALSSISASDNTILKQEGNSIDFYLDINNYPELKAMIPFLSDPNFEVYGPEYNQGMSEADYLDMIFYLLGEEAPDAIRNSTIEINFTLPGTITESSGITVTGDNTCTYSFPLIDFLLLNEPMSFSITWN